MTNERMTKAFALLLALVLIAGGAVIGIAAERWLLTSDLDLPERRGPPQSFSDSVERYERALGLDEDQVEVVETILKRQWSEMGEVMKTFDPKMEEIRIRSLKEIEAILRTEQLSRFTELKERHERRRSRMRQRFLIEREDGKISSDSRAP